MKVWIDAQLSPSIAPWIIENFGIEAKSVRELGLRDATDSEIFTTARYEVAVVMTKDSDFVDLVNRLGPPPQVIWLTCGNTSNIRLRYILSKTFIQTMALLAAGEPVVEIKDIAA
jgi:predicted nuclease of predicted toxin-antitoxin system